MRRFRQIAVLVHRWVGLALAAFLLTAGLTGCVLAFYRDLDAALNPELLKVRPPVAGAPLLDLIELRDRLAKQLPGGKVGEGVALGLLPDRSANYWIDERETFVDPYTGALLGTRRFGDLTEGRKNLLTFLYRFHYSLALGDVGVWIFGVVAVLWFVDCFVGAYLTFPRRASRAESDEQPRRAWMSRWARSWLVRTHKLFALVFTWHRASGLWVWGMFLVFAWSGVALNLGEQVYKPIMGVLLPEARAPERPVLAEPRPVPRLGWREALEQGRRLMRAEAAKRTFTIIGEDWLTYDEKRGAYRYSVDSSLDLDRRLAATAVVFDGDDGHTCSFEAPTGQSARATLDSWLIALHFGAVRPVGVAYRAFVSVLGGVVATLSVTGVWIWWRKRKLRRRA